MSFFPGKDPQAGDVYACAAIAHVVVPRTVDLGDGFSVRRALPSARSRMVGPFIFFDHFGPAEFRAGNGLDVRPHPHIGLATVTYLFDGEIMHRDSLGTAVAIKPGEVNWMTAGRGIVHSERTGPESCAAPAVRFTACRCGSRCPPPKKKMEAGFAHHATAEFPLVRDQRQNRARGGRLALWRAVAGADAARNHVRRRRTQGRRDAAARRRPRGARALCDRWHHRHCRRHVRARAPAGVQAGRPGHDQSRDRRAFRHLSAARRWTARATSGGISSPRAKSASSRPRRNGRPAISARCRATRSSSFRCRRSRASIQSTTRPHFDVRC